MEHSYFIRLTPRGALSYEDIIEVIESIGIKKWFICYEEASRPHYHACLFSDRGVENLRYQLKAKINAQIYISGKEIESKIKAIAYCMKDGNYRQQNIDILTIMSAKQLSKPKEKFDDELKVLIDDKDSSLRQIAKRIIDLHIKYNRKIYRAHIKATMELIRLKRCPDYREKFIDFILDEY